MFIAFWNLENLFDIETSTERQDWLKIRLGKELQGWTAAVLEAKLDQLAAGIKAMNSGAGPDVLGVCEVENRPVLEKLARKLNLPGRSYKVAHENSRDGRGIDVAVIYDGKLFTVDGKWSHWVMRRTGTRDLLQVNLKTRDAAAETLVVIVNHWPSRSGGEHASEPYRMLAGETLAYWHSRIWEVLGKDALIVAMGDFNDEPFNRSLTDYALADRERQKVLRAASAPRFLNLMLPLLAAEGSYVFDGRKNMLDQFLVSRGLLNATGRFRLRDVAVSIIRPPGVTGAPVRFSRPSETGGVNTAGYSDHFAIGLKLG
ncbi:MAG TPA: endonuclease/exonuclease/phosphatase [Verrucomicrobiales bacterium]|nr:endonuclease/exonuclease/phosphatase [Verrucomicrobiales bacterium]HRJ09861.1 hypothetical protein [Prosthecobacter sp.]HRK16107.1 hypothetical protein [Prosthecobacter sp.]